jgi:hypothetical protein
MKRLRRYQVRDLDRIIAALNAGSGARRVLYLSGVEGGKRNPSIGVLARIAKALSVGEFLRR